MGILDEAIKEHLELKRQHGAGESELKQLEDEAFGAAERPGDEASSPDPLAEAPTEFMAQPEVEAPKEEASEPDAEPPATPEEPSSRPAPRAEIADLQEAPPAEPQEPAPDPEAPAEEESPAMEHEVVPEPTETEILSGPSTEEREAIAEQPTEMYDVEGELSSSQAEAPSEEELVEEEMEEPRVTPVEDEYDEDDDFWDEKRLSDELDQALEAPSEAGEEEEVFFEGEIEPEAEAEAEEAPAQTEEKPPSGEQARHDEDVLEETPDFLEETPEDDQLWFEQKPPKDFDFDD